MIPLHMTTMKGEFMRPRKLSVLVLLFLFVVSTVVPTVAQTRDERLWQRALQIHRRAIVIDTHNDVTTPMTNDDFDLSGTPPAPYRTNIERMKKGGLTAEFFSLYIRPWYVEHGGSVRRTLDMIDSVYRAVERHPRDLMFATSVADIRRAKRQGRIAALMGIEGGHAIEDSLPTLREFYRLGVRYMTLTWNNTNNWGDAGRGEKKHNGLSEFGKEVVREMNRLGMLIDVSHVSDKTMSDALDISKAPIIASHSSARAISNVPRNIPDDLLKRIAKNGGVVHVNFYSVFVDTQTVSPQSAERDRKLKAQQDAIDEKYKNDPERRAEESDKLEASKSIAAASDLEVDRSHRSHRKSCRDRSRRDRRGFRRCERYAGGRTGRFNVAEHHLRVAEAWLQRTRHQKNTRREFSASLCRG